MSLTKVSSIHVESKKNSTSISGDTFAHPVPTINHNNSNKIKSNHLLLQNNINMQHNKGNLSICSESPTNLDISNNGDNNNNINQSKETLIQNEQRFDRNKNQIKKEKPSHHHITFIDLIPPFPQLATIIDIKSYKNNSNINSFYDDNKNSNRISSKNKCCLLI